MKKMDHKERLDKSLENIKSIKTKKPIFSPKGKKIFNASVISLGTIGVITGASIGIYDAATTSSQSTFPFHHEDQSAKQYQVNPDNITKITHKNSGSSVITTAQRGGVKFISNYDEMFNDDKLKDLSDWFYKDVNWGPEITTLHGINLLSGVQEDDGEVTLGYHTISRDGSIIVMSPDVIFNSTFPVQTAQNLTYWYTNAIKGTSVDHGNYSGDRAYKELYDAAKQGIVSSSYDWENESDQDDFEVFDKVIQDVVSKSVNDFGTDGDKQISFSTKMKSVTKEWDKLGEGEKINAIISILPSYAPLINLNAKLDQAKDLDSKYDIMKIVYDGTPLLRSSADTFLNSALESMGKPAFAKVDLIKGLSDAIGIAGSRNDLEQAFDKHWSSFITEAKAAANSEYAKIKALISRNLEPIKSLLSDNSFQSRVSFSSFKISSKDREEIMDESQAIDGDDRIKAGFLSQIVKYASATDLNNDGTNDPHFISQMRSLAGGSDEQVEKTLTSLLISFGQSNSYATKDEHLLALMKAATLLINWQGQRFGSTELYGFGPSKLSLGSNAVINLWHELHSKNASQLFDITPKELIKMVKEAATKNIKWIDPTTETAADEVNSKIEEVKNSWFKFGTALTQDLQRRIHPGNHDGTHDAGVAIWKEGDTPYDAMVRRTMTDMEYTISHEYGHHITMTYAQDISDDSDRKINSEALKEPSEDSLTSQWRYDLFKSAFKSGWYKKSLDAASDGDTRTDISYQLFEAEGLVGALGSQRMKYTSPGIRGEDKHVPQMVSLLPTVRDEPGKYTIFSYLNQSRSQGDVILTPLITPLEDGAHILKPDPSDPTWIPDSIKIPFEGGEIPYSQYVTSRHLNNYLCAVYSKALEIMQDKTIAPNGAALYQAADIVAGEYTRTLFDDVVGKYVTFDTPDDSSRDGKTLEEVFEDSSSDGLNNQILVYDAIVNSVLYTLSKDKPTVAEVKEEATKQITTYFQKYSKDLFNRVEFKISDEGVKRIVDDIWDGKFLSYTLDSASSPASAQFVFNHPGDEVKYQRKFSTIGKGVQAPPSFARYQMTYAEALTRLLQQLVFNVDAELLTEPGEYYVGDQMRFAAYGDDFYNLLDRGQGTPDGKITPEGRSAQKMWQNFFGLGKKIAAMTHSKDTGLSSIYGFVDKDEVPKYDHLVFEDKDGNIVSSAEMIYNVDNYHVYDVHGDPTSRNPLDDTKVSWMTNGMVIGNFANSQVKMGEYKLAFGFDKNKDGKITKDEVVHEITNSEVTHNGVVNNNGRNDVSAEIEGNPEDITDSDAQFEIKINDVRV